MYLSDFKRDGRRKKKIFKQIEGRQSPVFEKFLDYIRGGGIEETVSDLNLTEEENPFAQEKSPNWDNLFPDHSNGFYSDRDRDF